MRTSGCGVRRAAGALLLLALLGAAATGQAAESATSAGAEQSSLPLPVLVQRCNPAVVVIEVQLSSGASQGSGVILDPSGKVLTCNHVVKGATSAVVKMANGGYFPVEGLLGVNPSADLAVLRLRSQGLPTVPIGDASALTQGERVFVISSPVGLANTVSEGIVSGLRRVEELPEGLRSELLGFGLTGAQLLIQFTAPTSPGSSGGPVFNARGEVVGIVSIGVTSANNVYFAIPAKLAEPHLPNDTVLKFGARDGAAVATALGAVDPKQGELPASTGLLAPAETSRDMAIPKGSTPSLRLEEGGFVQTETVAVSYSDAAGKLSSVTHDPAAGEFRTIPGGVLLFNRAEAGRRIHVTYTYRAQRVAVMPVVNYSSIPEVGDMAREALQARLAERKYEVIHSAEVDAALRAAGINPTRGTWGLHTPVDPEDMRAFAALVNAAIVVYTEINAETWEARSRVVKVDLALGVFSGPTGKDLYTQILTDTRNTTFSSNKGARSSLVRGLTERAIKEFLGAR